MKRKYNGDREIHSVKELEEFQKEKVIEERRESRELAKLRSSEKFHDKQAMLTSLLFRGKGGDADAVQQLFDTAMLLLCERHAQDKKKGRKTDRKKAAVISTWAIRAALLHVEEHGVIDEGKLTTDTVELASQSGVMIAERTVRKYIKANLKNIRRIVKRK